jgi:RNA polymerase sigma factor (sigma-70 family)
MDSFNDSVTRWIGDLKDGQDAATQKIWERYFDRLVRVASRQLGAAPRRIADEEDVAVSVFDSLCKGAAAGRFDKLNDRDDLWRLLTAISGMKAVDQIRRQTAKKRGGDKLRGESIVAGVNNPLGGFDQLVHGEPTPEFLAVMDEQQQEMFRILPDETQRSVARLRFEGYANEEIAEKLDISLRSVERKLKVIREMWTTMIESEAESSAESK